MQEPGRRGLIRIIVVASVACGVVSCAGPRPADSPAAVVAAAPAPPADAVPEPAPGGGAMLPRPY